MRDIIGHGGGKGGGEQHVHYEATDSLHSISYARVLDLISEGEILGLANGTASVFLDGTPVQNADGSQNFSDITVDFRVGTQTQDYIPGFPDIENEVAVGVELRSTAAWTHAISNLSLSAIRITLGVPSLTKSDTTNGDVGGYQIDYQIELSKDGGAFAVVLTNSFNGKTTGEYRRSARIDLPPATTGWTIRVTRLTANANTASIADTTTIVSYTDVIDAKLRYPMSAIVGIQVDAKHFQSVPVRAYDMYGRIVQVPTNYDPVARTYTGVWDGTFKPAWTSCPPWIFRDMVLNDRYGLGARITDAQVDKWALYAIAKYCDEMVPNGKGGTEPRFACNVYLQSQKQAYAVLQDLASVFRGISYWGGGSVIASADMPIDPVYVYTAANVIGGKFSRVGSSKKTRYTVALVSWNDMTDFGKAKVEYVEDAEGIKRYGIQQVSMTAFGCSSQGQAQRVGRWALATSRFETGAISFDVGLDGVIALPGQIVRISDPARMGARNGGRIHSAAGRVVTLDKAPVINAGDSLTVILPSGVSQTLAVASVSGDSVTVGADWTTVPLPQSVWSVDSSALSAPTYKILSVKENKSQDAITYTVTATQHEPGKYAFVDSNTVIVPHVETTLDVTKQAAPASVTVGGYTVSLQDVQKLVLSVSCPVTAGAVAYQGAYRLGSGNWIDLPQQPNSIFDVVDVLAGTYVAKIAAVNSVGVTSSETLSSSTVITKSGNPINAGILLTPTAPAFHVTAGGANSPASITFNASLLALTGTISFACTGGTLTNITATSADLTYANMSGSSAAVTASITFGGTTYSAPCTVSKVQDGAAGATGPAGSAGATGATGATGSTGAAGASGTQVAIAHLYKWATSVPSAPTGTSTLTWTTGANGTYTAADGWSVTVPSNPGTPGAALYLVAVPVTAAAGVASTSVSYSGAAVQAWSLNGANGSNGASGVQSGAAIVYQWAATIPSGPTGSATLTWSTGGFGAAPTGWALTPGTSPSPGYTLWQARVGVTDSAVNTTTSFNWTSAAITAQGYAGTNGTGTAGADGASYVTAYCASSTASTTTAPSATTGKTSLPAVNSGGLTGTYSATVPTLTSGQYLYQTDGIYNPATNQVTWSIPYWSSLKVGSLSAIVANLGAINAGSIDIGTGTTSWHVDTAGNTWAGASSYGSAPYRVSNTGAAVFTNVTIMTGANTIIDGTGLKSGYEAPGTLNSALVPSINTAATTSTWAGTTGTGKPADNATVGADASNFTGTIGGDNLTPNASFEIAEPADANLAKGWGIWNNQPSTEPTTYSLVAGRLTGLAQQVSWINNHTGTKGVYGVVNTRGWEPFKTYIISIYVKITDLAAAVPMLLTWTVPPATTVALSNPNLSTSWQRYSFKVTMGSTVEPNGYAYISVGYGSSHGSAQFDDCMVVEGDVLPSYYGSVADAQLAANDRLSKSAANILTGGAGITAGTLTYNSSGARTGGYGVAMNSTGIVGFNSSGAATIAIDAATGNASFGGTLTANNMVATSHLVDHSVMDFDFFSTIEFIQPNNGTSFSMTAAATLHITATLAPDAGTGSSGTDSYGYNILKFNGTVWQTYPPGRATQYTHAVEVITDVPVGTYKVYANTNAGTSTPVTNMTILKFKK